MLTEILTVIAGCFVSSPFENHDNVQLATSYSCISCSGHSVHCVNSQSPTKDRAAPAGTASTLYVDMRVAARSRCILSTGVVILYLWWFACPFSKRFREGRPTDLSHAGTQLLPGIGYRRVVQLYRMSIMTRVP